MLKLISMIGSVIDKAQKDHVTAFSAAGCILYNPIIFSIYDRIA